MHWLLINQISQLFRNHDHNLEKDVILFFFCTTGLQRIPWDLEASGDYYILGVLKLLIHE